jgi:hypothetical protein
MMASVFAKREQKQGFRSLCPREKGMLLRELQVSLELAPSGRCSPSLTEGIAQVALDDRPTWDAADVEDIALDGMRTAKLQVGDHALILHGQQGPERARIALQLPLPPIRPACGCGSPF